MRTEIATPGMGIAPAVVMYDTKYAKNAARALRNCSAYGVGQLWITGDRWTDEWVGRKGKPRPPREERMKGYAEVDVVRCDMPLVAFDPKTCVRIGVEVNKTAQNIAFYDFPENPVFVFGPEDGSLPKTARMECSEFLILPTRHCLNLADAVGQTLSTWHNWKLRNGLEVPRPSYAMLDEARGYDDNDDDLRWAS